MLNYQKINQEEKIILGSYYFCLYLVMFVVFV